MLDTEGTIVNSFGSEQFGEKKTYYLTCYLPDTHVSELRQQQGTRIHSLRLIGATVGAHSWCFNAPKASRETAKMKYQQNNSNGKLSQMEQKHLKLDNRNGHKQASLQPSGRTRVSLRLLGPGSGGGGCIDKVTGGGVGRSSSRSGMGPAADSPEGALWAAGWRSEDGGGAWLRLWVCWRMFRHSPRQLRVAADVALSSRRSWSRQDRGPLVGRESMEWTRFFCWPSAWDITWGQGMVMLRSVCQDSPGSTALHVSRLQRRLSSGDSESTRG